MPPNILVFLTDDHGSWASGAYGNREVHTPSMDYLAADGVRFENAFTPSPVCSPARACFFTGRLPSQHGIHDWIQESAAPEKNWLVGETNIAEILHDRGYQTALIGKWHLGQSHLPQPGFDRWFGHTHGQYPHFGKQFFSDQGNPVEALGHQSLLLTDEALKFLRRRDKGRPFFLFVGLVDTHTPHTGHPPRLVEKYRHAAFSDILTEEQKLPVGMKARSDFLPKTEAERREWHAEYYASVETIDSQLGRVMDELQSDGSLDETLVVYTSDHGHMNGQHGLFTKGNATIPQNFYEESIRIPLLMRWPGVIPKGAVKNEFVDHLDLFQTLAEAGTAKIPSGKSLPGKSFLNLLKNGDDDWRREQICEYGNARMIRDARYKLIRRYAPHAPEHPDELYDLQTDPRETVNLMDRAGLASEVSRLAGKLDAHFVGYENPDAHFAKYEVPERSGRQILSQPEHNPWEPWRLKI